MFSAFVFIEVIKKIKINIETKKNKVKIRVYRAQVALKASPVQSSLVLVRKVLFSFLV